MYEIDCADTESMFRIIQCIPSPKAEPFKRWLAKVGFEWVQEIENSELVQDRAKGYYKMKGYPRKISKDVLLLPKMEGISMIVIGLVVMYLYSGS